MNRIIGRQHYINADAYETSIKGKKEKIEEMGRDVTRQKRVRHHAGRIDSLAALA